jgi:hypothetical protein
MHRLVFKHSYSSSYTIHHQTTSVMDVMQKVQTSMHAVQHSKATFQSQEHILTYLLVNNNIKNDFCMTKGYAYQKHKSNVKTKLACNTYT